MDGRAVTIHFLPIRFDFDSKGDDLIYIAIFNYTAIQFDSIQFFNILRFLAPPKLVFFILEHFKNHTQYKP